MAKKFDNFKEAVSKWSDFVISIHKEVNKDDISERNLKHRFKKANDVKYKTKEESGPYPALLERLVNSKYRHKNGFYVIQGGQGAIESNDLLSKNNVEHRYYGRSKPKTIDWKYLNTWQASSDHHRIINILKNIYPGKWISTGKSKGGMAALFHRVNYPTDVDASIVFVAPIILGLADNRFTEHINKLSNGINRKKIEDFQAICLKRKKALLKIIDTRKQDEQYTIGFISALEWSVVEFPYEFWWRNSNPNEIPDKTESDISIVDYLNRISPLSNFSDSRLKYNAPLFYQQATELGFYGYDLKHLAPFLETSNIGVPVSFAPIKISEQDFNPLVMQDALEYLQEKANNIIYMYGENDIFTAARVIPSEETNSIEILADGKAHQFEIGDLSPKNQALILRTLKEWLKED